MAERAEWIKLSATPDDGPPWDGEPVLIATNHRIYSRPDVFQFAVDRSRRTAVTFED